MNEPRIEPTFSDTGAGTADTVAPDPVQRWFNSRPIPVFIISTWCILQFAGTVIATTTHWHEIIEMITLGTRSAASLVMAIFYSITLFLAGVYFLRMKKAALVVFCIYFVWGCVTAVLQHNLYGNLSLPLVVGVIIYCFRLQQAGRLS